VYIQILRGSVTLWLLLFCVSVPPWPTVTAQVAGCSSTPYDCAVSSVERGDFAAAIRSLDQVLAASPADLKALNLLGIALTGAGEIDKANARFRQALTIDPSFYPALKNLAINEFNAGRRAEAQRHLEEVLTRAPDDEVTHVHLGEIAFYKKDARAAISHYEKGRGRTLQNPAWTLHYAASLLDQHQTAKATEILDHLAERDAKSRFEAGVLLGKAGAHHDAARFFASSRDGYDDPAAAGYNQTLMLVEAGEYDDAIRAAEELIARGTASADLYNLLSRAHLKAGHIKEAYDALRTATRLEPSAEENYVDLAGICLDHQNYDLGLEIIDIGLQYRPESPILHLQRGVVLAMRADLGPAEREFESAHRLAPDHPAPYAGLAMIWMQTGQTQKAVETLRSETTTRKNDHVVPYIFAVALMRSGLDPAGPEAAEAIDALKTSIRLNAEFAPARSELGRLLLKRDDVDGAIRELQKAVALDSGSTAAIYNLAQAYRRRGDRMQAAELLARLSKLNAQERGDDPTADLKRMVVRIVREGAASKP
jgi:tetratricopeptide (TPR) repeat protein